MNTFKLIIISDSKTVFSGMVQYCGVTTLSGSIGFEARHEPYMGILKPGSEIRYTDGSGNEHSAAVEDGMLTFKENECSVVVSLNE